MTSPDITDDLVCAELRLPRLKRFEESLQKLVHKAYATGESKGQSVKNFLNGVSIDDSLHVIFTDRPIGARIVALGFNGLKLMRHNRVRPCPRGRAQNGQIDRNGRLCP